MRDFELTKNYNLLDEQLAESGLEMSIGLISTGLLGAGISGLSSVVGGIFGASQADKANKAQKKAYKDQQKAAEEAAKLQNEYNKKKFEVDKENYYKNTEYNFQTAMQQYNYDTAIRAYEEKQTARQYQRDVERQQAQYAYNKYAFDTGSRNIQFGLEEQRVADLFERQDSLVANLEAQGQAQIKNAGTSKNKLTQGLLAKMGRDIAIMDASRKSAIDAANAELLDLSYNKYVGDRNVALSAMLRPENLPSIPAPMRPPDPTWLEPMKILPQYVSAPIPQSITAPVVQGLINAAGSLANVNWNAKQDWADKFKIQKTNQAVGGSMSNPFQAP